MFEKIKFYVLAVLILLFIGCAGSKSASGYNSTLPSELEKLIEGEYKDDLTAVGSAEGEKEDISVRKAEVQARAALAREFKAQVDQLQKSYEESVNDKTLEEYNQVVEIFATVEMENVKVVKSLVKELKNGKYSAKVLIAMSANDIKNSIENKLGTYTSFKASKAYKELEERVAAVE